MKPINYHSLLESFPPSNILAEDSEILPDELELQRQWFCGDFGTEFVANESGHKVRIKQMGFWNHSAGPDFVHCCVEIDGVEHTGAIELDTSAKHWELHGHHRNATFNEVILHVVFCENNPILHIRTLDQKHVPQVIIRQKPSSPMTWPQESQLQLTHLGRCSQPLASIPTARCEQILKAAVEYRIERKAKRIRTIAELHSCDQSLWLQLAEVLGYRYNANTMVTLAHRIPISQLVGRPVQQVHAILFGAAAWLHPEIHEEAPVDSQKWLQSQWQTWWQLRQEFEFSENKQLHWTLGRARPVNHPQRRLAALALIAEQWKLVKQHYKAGTLSTFLTTLEDNFWSLHYTLTSKQASRPMALMGKSKANEWLVNFSLPLQIFEDRPGAIEKYYALPAPVASERVKRAHHRLFGEHPDKHLFLKKAWHHQALLQIYQDFCMEHIPGCEDCPFPEQLLDWSR